MNRTRVEEDRSKCELLAVRVFGMRFNLAPTLRDGFEQYEVRSAPSGRQSQENCLYLLYLPTNATIAPNQSLSDHLVHSDSYHAFATLSFRF